MKVLVDARGAIDLRVGHLKARPETMGERLGRSTTQEPEGPPEEAEGTKEEVKEKEEEEKEETRPASMQWPIEKLSEGSFGPVAPAVLAKMEVNQVRLEFLKKH